MAVSNYSSIVHIFCATLMVGLSFGKLIFSFFAVKIVMAIAITVINVFKGSLIEPSEIIQILRSKMYWVLFVYFLMIAGLISFVRMVSQKFGPGILWNMFIGRYRNPREEQRVFMFLDLKSSTDYCRKTGTHQIQPLNSELLCRSYPSGYQP